MPSTTPTSDPTLVPSTNPSLIPSAIPTMDPSITPTQTTMSPTINPLTMPSDDPTVVPTTIPTAIPTATPSNPTASPSTMPSADPSHIPSAVPSAGPTLSPSMMPSDPSVSPSAVPSTIPSAMPSGMPSVSPSMIPSNVPTDEPSTRRRLSIDDIGPNVTWDNVPLNESIVIELIFGIKSVNGTGFADDDSLDYPSNSGGEKGDGSVNTVDDYGDDYDEDDTLLSYLSGDNNDYTLILDGEFDIYNSDTQIKLLLLCDKSDELQWNDNIMYRAESQYPCIWREFYRYVNNSMLLSTLPINNKTQLNEALHRFLLSQESDDIYRL